MRIYILLFVTMEFLSVPGDEGDGIALVQQSDDIFHMLWKFIQFFGDLNDNWVHKTVLSVPKCVCDVRQPGGTMGFVQPAFL